MIYWAPHNAIRRPTVGDDFAVGQFDNPLGMLGDFGIVGHGR